MALTTYSELKTSIADFLNRDDLTAVIPDFITLAEKGMNKRIRHWQMEKRSQANINAQYSSLPVDFIEPVRLTLTGGDTHVLQLTNAYEIAKLRAANNNSAGRPTDYVLLDGSIEVFPTPDTTYQLEILYYSTLNPLNNSNASNWILSNHPEAYLYGSLLHSAPYLQEDQRLAAWASLYESAISAINEENDNSKAYAAGASIRIRSYG